MLAQHECYKALKKIDIGPMLAVLDQLRFIDSKGKCAWVTDPASQAPQQLLDLVNSLGLGGKYERVFCRRLEPHQNIAPHVDDWMGTRPDWRRFQIPLTSHSDIKMRWPDDGIEAHLAPGYLYEVRFDRLHEVWNPTDCSRIHIQIDQSGATI